VKRLLAFVLVGGLFAMGCSGATTTGGSKKGASDSGRGSPHAPSTEKPGKPEAGKPGKGEAEKPSKPEPALARIGLDVESLTLAKGKDEGTLTIKVDRADSAVGDVTLKLDAPPELKLEKDTVIVPKGKDEAKVKVTAVKRDKSEVTIKVTATADKAKESTKEVTVKIEK
jgi:hypothetical protein